MIGIGSDCKSWCHLDYSLNATDGLSLFQLIECVPAKYLVQLQKYIDDFYEFIPSRDSKTQWARRDRRYFNDSIR